MKRQRTVSLIALVMLSASAAQSASSTWLASPPPKFPPAALSKGSEGYVIVRAYIGQDGAVTHTAIKKSSGDATLDEAARTALLQWRMKPAMIRAEYATKGFEQRIDFRQETPVAARYRDRAGYFGTYQSAQVWTYAPFPDYPFHERLTKAEGVARVRVTIGADGSVASAELVKSSGYENLDKAAIAAVAKWRAHKEYAGRRDVIPINFTMHPLRK